MATITTKFSLGDVVWHADTMQVRKQHPCPDCLGTQKWSAKSPTGKDYEFPCPRCQASFSANHELSLAYTDVTASARRLTIGQVRAIDPVVNDGGYPEGTQYMCRETGIGSGTLYDEARLFATEEEALAAGKALAEANKKNLPWIGELFNKSLAISDYELKDAMVHDAEARQSRYAWTVSDLIGDLECLDSIDEVKDAIAKWKEKQS
jgi:hypothetical protein